MEPYADRLRGALGEGLAGIELIEKPVQEVPWETFARLDPGDILFIDSTHVSKPGSDVNRLFLDILPRMPVGVLVHVHDIFDGFELPPPWLEQGRDWGEAYLLRAFLSHNRDWEIVAFTERLWQRHDWLRAAFPAGTPGPDGLWMQRVT